MKTSLLILGQVKLLIFQFADLLYTVLYGTDRCFSNYETEMFLKLRL